MTQCWPHDVVKTGGPMPDLFPTTQEAEADKAKEIGIVNHLGPDSFKPDGLRPFFEYRKLGLEELTNGKVRADELQVLAGGGIAGPMGELAKKFETMSGLKLVIRYGTTPELIKMATSGDPFDVAVVPREVFRDESARAKIPPGPMVDIARV